MGGGGGRGGGEKGEQEWQENGESFILIMRVKSK